MYNLWHISIIVLLLGEGHFCRSPGKVDDSGNDIIAVENRDYEIEKNGQKPVKLNLKQGLLMNQVIEIYALRDAAGESCRNHSGEFAAALRSVEAWALKMFDSSSKLQTGILYGNLFDFGNYKQCISISQDNLSGRLRGKHCTLKLHPDEFLLKKVLHIKGVSEKRWNVVKVFVESSTLSWSVCVPDSCDAAEVLSHFRKLINGLTERLSITVSLKETDCHTEVGITYGNIELAVIGGLLVYVAAIGLFTVADVLEHQSVAVRVFSIKRNVRKIFAKNNAKGSSDLDCLHGLRFLSTCYVIIGHRYLMMMFFPVVNSLQIMDWILYYRSTAITGGTLCVDTFFMISGMLVSLGFFKVASEGKINWSMFYFYRFMRITPPLAIVVLWHCTVIQHFGSGPLWNDMLEIVQKPCQEYWWATILHIQNYVHPYPLCLTQTWYLTCDMQYYFLSPIILVPLRNNKVFGCFSLAVIYCVSILVNFYLAWINAYNGAVPVTNQLFGTKYFQHHYIAPHVRSSTYIIGLGFGYLLHVMPQKRIKIPAMAAVVGWIVCIISMLASLMGCHVFFLEDHEYSKLESSLYLAISRSTWTLGVVWIVWACVNGYGGIINSILSLHLFRVLGRISYGMYLLHMGGQYLISGAAKTPKYFSDFDSLDAAFADLFLMTIAGFLFTVFFEGPLIQSLGLLAIKKKKIDKLPIKIQPNQRSDKV